MENNYYKFRIPQRPIAKSNMYRARCIGKRAIIYTTKDLEDYELEVGRIVGEAIPETLDGLHALYIRIYQCGKRWIDVDNSFKALLDGTDSTKRIKRGNKIYVVCETGIKNDKLYNLIMGERVFVETAKEERIEGIITPYRGIFNFTNTIAEAFDLNEDYWERLYMPDI